MEIFKYQKLYENYSTNRTEKKNKPIKYIHTKIKKQKILLGYTICLLN